MAKNILVFSDGTGQAGGLRPDQQLSNVYKLYRATRTGPDSPIDPATQIAFYETGLGSAELQGPAWMRPFSFLRKSLASALGIGFMTNVADCYEAILKVYEPGDRIFLFGFSRGAYTVRSLAGVMNLCGVPVKDRSGNPIPRRGKELRAIVDEAVRTVYEHGAGHPRGRYESEREEQARRFRVAYGTQNDPQTNERGNIVPYFIGVFDTVAALGSTGIKKYLTIGLGVLGGLALSALAALFISSIVDVGLLVATIVIAILLALGIFGLQIKSKIKTISNFPTAGKRSWHRAAWRFQHYDQYLDPRVRYARHAIAIDETRATFARVPWGRRSDMANTPDDWLVQVWFPGNHSDVGGSYPEQESRLSDIALKWMVEQATTIPHPIYVDFSKLHLFPDAGGIQHCVVMAVREMYPHWLPKRWRRSWTEAQRIGKLELAACHPAVRERLALPSIVKHGVSQPYRPEPLRHEPSLSRYFNESKG